MKARVTKAWVNLIEEWRVYYRGELIATFRTEAEARKYAKFIDEQE
jgi:hypothetical protein